jgi:Spy/CpxP family protein refolding chaperone
MAHRLAKIAITGALIAAPIALTAAPAFADPFPPGNHQPDHRGPQPGPGHQQGPGPQHPNPAPFPTGSAA